MLIKESDIPDDIYPLSINPVGNYAFGVNWSDGHSLFPIDQLVDLAVPLDYFFLFATFCILNVLNQMS